MASMAAWSSGGNSDTGGPSNDAGYQAMMEPAWWGLMQSTINRSLPAGTAILVLASVRARSDSPAGSGLLL
jgi:hypothetical protein